MEKDIETQLRVANVIVLGTAQGVDLSDPGEAMRILRMVTRLAKWAANTDGN